MRVATDAEIAAAKAQARAKLGTDRLVAIPLGPPFNVELLLAAWDLPAASKHADARLVSIPNAANALVVERAVWPSADNVEALRVRYGLLDAEVEGAMRREHGFAAGDVVAVPLSPTTTPPGFSSAKGMVEALAALAGANDGADLWSVTHRENGLALILRAPLPEVVTAVGQAAADSVRTKSGSITWALGYARDLCAWAPGGGDPKLAFDRHIAEQPGRADELGPAIFAMGGAGAARRGRFL